jgi:hypothetical protein
MIYVNIETIKAGKPGWGLIVREVDFPGMFL